MKYITNKQKAISFIVNSIIPEIRNRDLDLNKLLSFLYLEKAISNKLAKEILDNLVLQGEIKIENNILTIPDTKLEDYFKELREREIIIEEELKEVIEH